MENKKKKTSETRPDIRPDRMPGTTTAEAQEDQATDPPGKTPAVQPDKRMRIVAALLALVILGGVIFFGLPLLQSTLLAPAQGTGSGTLTVYYFYGAECPHCHKVTPYVESLQKKYPDIDFQILEVWHNDTNNALLTLLNHKLGRTSQGVPEAVVGTVALLGEDEIITGIEPAILNQKGNLSGSSQLGAVPVTGSSAGTNATITALYFYGNGCSHCENVRPLIADIQARYPGLQLRMLEINDNKTNRENLLAMYRLHGLNGGSIPTVFIGDQALVGENEIKDHFEETVIAEKQRGASAPTITLAPSSPVNLPAGNDQSVSAIFFYSDSCSHCENVKPVIATISSRYPDLNLTRLEISHNVDNQQQFNEMSSRYGIPNPGVPAIFIGNNVLIGEVEIKNRFEAAILAEEQRIASGTPVNLSLVNHGSLPATTALSLFMVIFAALLDSTNPCGLSVLVFLLITMAAAGSRRRILLAGGAYIAAMFLFHLLVGIGLFSVFSLSGLSKPFSIIGGIIALLFGIINIADLLRNRETFFLSIGENRKGLLGDYARMATLPAAFVLGILAGLFGFTCTGGIYISILGLMGRDMSVMSGLSWLVLYNLIFVLPLVMITLLVAYGVSPERAEELRTRHKRLLRIIISAILIGLGLIILFGWIG